jgi:hypothetical protein
LFRIASDQPIVAPDQTLVTTFEDSGLDKQLIAPPDPNFDHANFYWRMEQQPESAVTIHSPITIGNNTLQMAANGYHRMTVRITRGTGEGQDRAVSANDQTTLTISPAWN